MRSTLENMVLDMLSQRSGTPSVEVTRRVYGEHHTPAEKAKTIRLLSEMRCAGKVIAEPKISTEDTPDGPLTRCYLEWRKVEV